MDAFAFRGSLAASLIALWLVPISAQAAEEDAAEEDAAEEAQEEKEPVLEKGEGDIFGHMGQFGLRLGFVYGYRIPFRYESSPFCKDPAETSEAYDEEPKVCGFSGPPAFDVAGSFAVLDGIEPFIWARFGLSGEADTSTKALRLFGVGTRIYTASESRFKFFIEPGLAWETEGGTGFPNAPQKEYKKDMVFHLAFGPHYDFAKAFGVYLDAGADVGIFRAINTTLEVVLGAQLRVP